MWNAKLELTVIEGTKKDRKRQEVILTYFNRGIRSIVDEITELENVYGCTAIKEDCPIILTLRDKLLTSLEYVK